VDAHALAYEALSWLASQPQWLALAVCGFIAFIEYPVPPLPHDVVVVAGGVLAARALLDPTLLIGVVTIGSVLGALAAWKLGGLAGTHPRVARFIARFVSNERLEQFREKYRRRGRLLIAANRFLPGVRTTIMFAAGLFRVPAADVALFGAFSAFLWNGLLIGLGFLLGQNLDAVITAVERYSLVAWGVVGVVVVVVAVRAWLWHARRNAAARAS
jgi:membrane protein DedA with SNARE-associated domain